MGVRVAVAADGRRVVVGEEQFDAEVRVGRQQECPFHAQTAAQTGIVYAESSVRLGKRDPEVGCLRLDAPCQRFRGICRRNQRPVFVETQRRRRILIGDFDPGYPVDHRLRVGRNDAFGL